MVNNYRKLKNGIEDVGVCTGCTIIWRGNEICCNGTTVPVAYLSEWYVAAVSASPGASTSPVPTTNDPKYNWTPVAVDYALVYNLWLNIFRFQHCRRTASYLWVMSNAIAHSCRLRFNLFNALWLPVLLLVFVRENIWLPALIWRYINEFMILPGVGHALHSYIAWNRAVSQDCSVSIAVRESNRMEFGSTSSIQFITWIWIVK